MYDGMLTVLCSQDWIGISEAISDDQPLVCPECPVGMHGQPIRPILIWPRDRGLASQLLDFGFWQRHVKVRDQGGALVAVLLKQHIHGKSSHIVQLELLQLQYRKCFSRVGKGMGVGFCSKLV